jgi:hypothetical protein
MTAVRRDSAVHVSLSSDSLIKQPGTLRSHPPAETRGPSKLRASDNDRKPVHLYREELRRRDITPKSNGAPCQTYIAVRFSAVNTSSANSVPHVETRPDRCGARAIEAYKSEISNALKVPQWP